MHISQGCDKLTTKKCSDDVETAQHCVSVIVLHLCIVCFAEKVIAWAIQRKKREILCISENVVKNFSPYPFFPLLSIFYHIFTLFYPFLFFLLCHLFFTSSASTKSYVDRNEYYQNCSQIW